MRRLLFAAVAFASLLYAIVVPTAFAECMNWPIRATERLDAGHAFIATVTEASRDVDPPKPDNSDFDWHVELTVERTYRGDVPDRIVYNGWDVGCHELRGDGLRTGDRIFVAAEGLHMEYLPVDPFEGHVIVWRQTGDGWALDEDALSYGSDAEFYPEAARSATTTADILRLISDPPAPDTSISSAPKGPDDDPPVPALALVFLAGIVVALAHLSRARGPDPE
jgi:hypothetical protein